MSARTPERTVRCVIDGDVEPRIGWVAQCAAVSRWCREMKVAVQSSARSSLSRMSGTVAAPADVSGSMMTSGPVTASAVLVADGSVAGTHPMNAAAAIAVRDHRHHAERVEPPKTQSPCRIAPPVSERLCDASVAGSCVAGQGSRRAYDRRRNHRLPKGTARVLAARFMASRLLPALAIFTPNRADAPRGSR